MKNQRLINIKCRIENEIKCLSQIIEKVEKLEGECTHEKGELYALNWVIGMMNDKNK